MRTQRGLIPRKRFLWSVVSIAAFTLGAAPERTIHTNTSNKELKQKTLQLVKNVKELIYSYNKKDRELMTDYDKKNRPEIRIDERKAMRQQWLRDSDSVHDSFLRQYKDKYWADAILLRDELYRRLPKRMHQPALATIYQHPTNILGVEVIANHLEVISKSLPDS
jgi:hypothetical protein